MQAIKFIVDSTLTIENFYYTQSLIYLDSNEIERVAYSANLRNDKSNGLDLVWDEFIKEKKRLGFNNLIVINQNDYDKRLSQYKAHRVREEKLITKADYEWKLNCLPPQRWTKLDSIEIFHMKELLCLNLVTWLGKIGSHYFELVDEKTADLKSITLRFEALASYSRAF